MHSEASARNADLSAIRELCVARSYMGRDIREVFSYGDLWADLVIGSYELFAPDLIWLAQEARSDRILGYLTGAAAAEFYPLQERYLAETVERLRQQSMRRLTSNPLQFWSDAVSMLAGLDARTLEFLQYLRIQAAKEMASRPKTPHFNVFVREDGRGIARALIAAFMQELGRRRVSRYHISALYFERETERLELEAKGFRVRSLDFFTSRYSLCESRETAIFNPYHPRFGVFERDVPG